MPEGGRRGWESVGISTACRLQGTTETTHFTKRPHPRKERQILFDCSPFQGTLSWGLLPYTFAISPVLHVPGCHQLCVCLEPFSISELTFPSEGKVKMRVFALHISEKSCDKIFHVNALCQEQNAMVISGGITC